MERSRYVVISADGHAGADLRGYRPYLESSLHDEFDRWVVSYVNPFMDLLRPEANRNWDSDVRNEALEADGVVGEVVYPNTVPPFFPRGGLVASAPPADQYRLRLAGLRAHNRWLADWCSRLPGRRAGIGQILLNDVDDAIATSNGSPSMDSKAARCGLACRPASRSIRSTRRGTTRCGGRAMDTIQAKQESGNIGVMTIRDPLRLRHKPSYPHTREALAHTYAGIDPVEVEGIVGGNAARVYGFDLAQLRRVADRVGPAVDAVFAGIESIPSPTTSFTFGPRTVGVA